MTSILLGCCLVFGAFSTQTDWTGGMGLVGPVSTFNTRFHTSDSITYNVSGQISPLARSVSSRAWIRHIVEDNNPRIDGHGGLYPADFDGDGDLDFSGYKSLACSMALYRNHMVENGTVDYQLEAQYPTPVGTKGKYAQTWAGDINNDGRPDVAVACSTRVFWYENNGNFSFTLHEVDNSTIHTNGGVDGGDINRDGLVDLLVGDRPLDVYFQEPGGTFRRQYVWTGESYKVLVGDINGDQWPDILAEDQVFLNNNGTFPPAPTWSAGLSGPDGIWIRDFNNDGLTDLLICDQWSNRPGIYWYENTGNGTSFTRHTVYRRSEARQYGDGACAEDLYTDGMPDIVGTYSKVGWFDQVSPGEFELTQVDTITDSHWARTGNLDYKPGGNDMDIDIYASGRGKFVWWENAQQSTYSANGWLVSSVLDAGFMAVWQRLVWDATRPAGTTLEFFVRSGATPAQCTTSNWCAPIAARTGVGPDSTGIEQFTGSGDRYFQYRVLMAGYNGTMPGLSPAVYSVKVVFARHVDVGVERIQQPVGSYPENSEVTPLADWRNYGSNQADFRAFCFLTNPAGTRVFTQYRDVTGLAPGDSVSVSFQEYNVGSAAGTWTVRCSTAAAEDMHPANDWLDGEFQVSGTPPRVEIGIERIRQPVGYYREGENVAPIADWRNYGTDPTDFTVYCFLVDPSSTRVYTRTAPVSGLAPGQPVTVEFPSFNVGSTTGWWMVRCSTYAENDVYRGNDQRDADFHVGGPPPPRYGWIEVSQVPAANSLKAVKDGAWLTAARNGMIYCAKGNRTGDFYEYEPRIGSGLWRQLESIPALEAGLVRPPYRGCRGASDGGTGIYMVKGNNTVGFWRYDLALDTWSRLPDVPLGAGRKVKSGSDLAYCDDGDTGWVYLLKGYGTEFYRYNVQVGRWDTLPSAPYGGGKARYGSGSFLVYDEAASLYAHQAKYTGPAAHFMFRFDLAAAVWDTLALRGMPLLSHQGKLIKKRSKDGGCGTWLDDKMYALKGGNTQQFFCYMPAADSWQELDTMPSVGTTGKKKRVKNGGDMVSSSVGGLYALKGNNTLEFWRYVMPPAQPVAARRPPQTGAMARPVDEDNSPAIAPNPLTGGFATLRLGRTITGSAVVRVYDALGRCVLSRSFVAARSDFTLPLDLRKLSSGVYLVRLEAIGNDFCEKLIIQR